MRRALLVLSAVAALAVPASARAAVTADRDAPDVAAALSAPARVAGCVDLRADRAGRQPRRNLRRAARRLPDQRDQLRGAQLWRRPQGRSRERARGRATTAARPDPASQRPSVYDLTTLRLDLRVPAGFNCASVNFRFGSDEYPEFKGTQFNDAFIAELDTSTWTTSGSVITAANNFAFDPANNPITINAAGFTSMTEANAAGTTYDGATPLLSASQSITPGVHSLYFSIFDQGDGIYDSAVLLDDLDLQQRPATDCVRGAQDEICRRRSRSRGARQRRAVDRTRLPSGRRRSRASGGRRRYRQRRDPRRRDAGVDGHDATGSGTARTFARRTLAPSAYGARAIHRVDAGNIGVSETDGFSDLAFARRRARPGDPPDAPEP